MRRLEEFLDTNWTTVRALLFLYSLTLAASYLVSWIRLNVVEIGVAIEEFIPLWR